MRRLLFDALIIVVCLLFTADLYYLGDLRFSCGIVAILALVASNVYTWQLRRLIRKSEKELETMYLNELERRGQGNGSRVKVEK